MKQRAFDVITGDKQLCRESLCILSKAHKILTLPGREALCVQTFKKHYPNANIRAIEREREDWEVICSKGIDCTLGTVQDYVKSIQSETLHHDIIFLDYFSFLHEGVMEDIMQLINNPYIIHKGKPCVLGITLKKNDQYGRYNMDEKMKESFGFRKEQEVNNTLHDTATYLSTTIAIEGGCEQVTEIKRLEYRAGEKSSLMYFLAFTIIK